MGGCHLRPASSFGKVFHESCCCCRPGLSGVRLVSISLLVPHLVVVVKVVVKVVVVVFWWVGGRREATL